MVRCPDPIEPRAAGFDIVLAVIEALAIVGASIMLGALIAWGVQ